MHSTWKWRTLHSQSLTGYRARRKIRYISTLETEWPKRWAQRWWRKHSRQASPRMCQMYRVLYSSSSSELWRWLPVKWPENRRVDFWNCSQYHLLFQWWQCQYLRWKKKRDLFLESENSPQNTGWSYGSHLYKPSQTMNQPMNRSRHRSQQIALHRLVICRSEGNWLLLWKSYRL